MCWTCSFTPTQEVTHCPTLSLIGKHIHAKFSKEVHRMPPMFVDTFPLPSSSNFPCLIPLLPSSSLITSSWSPPLFLSHPILCSLRNMYELVFRMSCLSWKFCCYKVKVEPSSSRCVPYLTSYNHIVTRDHTAACIFRQTRHTLKH